MARLLVIDDEPQLRELLRAILIRDGHRVDVAADRATARELIAEHEFELALCDVNLEAESGLDLAQEITTTHREVAVVMVTGVDDPALANLALDIGAYGYVVKPFRETELVIAVANALRRRRLEIENRAHRKHLEGLVRDRTVALQTSREETIRRLAAAADARDHETGQHIERVARVVELLAGAVGLPRDRRELLRIASPLHDVGKIAVPDHILLKPGILTPEEREAMEAHAERGHEMLAGSGEPMLELAATIAWTHHERWDGSGYPRGLAGEEIPIEGRIVAIVDVFDALLSHRSYRPAVPLSETVQRLRQGRGAHFDPLVLDRFLDVLPDALRIREEFADDRPHPLLLVADAG